LVVSVVALLSVPAVGPGAAQDAPNGTIYMGGYDGTIRVIDEATMEVTNTIQMQTGIPVGITLSASGGHLYVRDASMEHLEIVDVASNQVVDWFTLSEGRTKVRYRGVAVDPLERFVVMTGRSYTKARDRWEIGRNLMLKVDLESHQVTDTVPWPDGEELEGSRLMFSPDGELLYFFAGDIIALETEGFTEVDRWELSQPLESGMGRFRFGFPSSPYDEEGVHTGLFRVNDPVNNRTMMGVARVNLAGRNVDFYTLGPSEPLEFSLAPGGTRAYGLLEEIGRFEFWTFDLENRRIDKRVPFAGRPRMALMPSTNGELLYIHQAGNTVDIYDSDSFELVRTVEYDVDMTDWVLVPGGDRGGP
jgi:DNA-binding beta-propeller fold protein YncE